ncbi:MAG: PTS sugar transporter subunit IIC, partial [Fusobacteriaceae bacterium]
MAFFNNMVGFMDKYFAPLANKIGSQRHMLAIRDGIVPTMPITIVGSLFLILGNLPFNGYSDWLANKGVDKYLSFGSDVAFGIMGIIAVICIAYRLAISYKMEDLALSCGIISLVGYFITLMPTRLEGGLAEGISMFDYFGARSLFVAIIIALISTEIMKKIVDLKLTIKMPESVPPSISRSFTSLIPGFIVILFWVLVTSILVNTSYKNIHDMINVILATPIRNAGNSFWGILGVLLVETFFWTLGIHGSLVVSPVMDPIILSNSGV